MFILLYARDGRTHRHPLRPGDTVVGRAPICDLPIDDPSISRRHVRFRVHGDHCVLTDLGGRNGTFLNGEPVTEAAVKAGDAVVLGRFPLRVDHALAGPVVFIEAQSAADTGLSIVRPLFERYETGAVDTPVVAPERLLRLIDELARQLARYGSVSELLDRIITVALDAIPADRAFVLLIDDRGELVPRVMRARNRPITNATLSGALVRRAIQEKVAMLGWDAAGEPEPDSALRLQSENVRSFMCMPLCTENRVIGLLYLDSPQSTPLSVGDLDVLQALGCYSAAAIEHAHATHHASERLRLRERLQRHHSTAVVQRLLDQAEAVPARVTAAPAEERDVTVLIADIVEFTHRSKGLSPIAAAQLLDLCLSLMSEAVFAEDGTLDKFDGEALVAVFGAPLPQPDHAARALRVAEAMRRVISSLAIDPPVFLRIALNSGPAITGEIGSSKRRDYTVLGDVVNECWNMLSSGCRPGQIAIGATTRERLEKAQNE